MEQTCNGSQCQSHESIGSSDCCNVESCNCPGCSQTDPVDFAMIQWHQAVMAAMLELKKDKIKERLAQSHGDLIDKGSDAVVEAVGKTIQSVIQKNSVKSELRSKLASLMREI